MSTDNKKDTLTLAASGDLSGQQFRIVKLTATGIAVANATDLNQIGVLQDKPNALGVAGCVAITGVSKVKLGGVVAAGDRLTSDASGNAVVAVAGEQVVGIALVAGAANDIGTILLSPRGVV